MRPFFHLFTSLLICLAGCSPRSPEKAVPPVTQAYPPPDPGLMEFLKRIYEAHGTPAVLEGDWLLVDGGRLRTRAALFGNDTGRQTSVQADFITLIPEGRHLIESFGGWGSDKQTAAKDACEAFQNASFHPLHSALLGKPCSYNEVETWEIGGIPRTVTIGPFVSRGEFPGDAAPELMKGIEAGVKASGLPRGLHWVRYFYARLPGSEPTIEVLLDNKPWIPLKKAAADLPWPVRKEFYTARLFFIIQDA